MLAIEGMKLPRVLKNVDNIKGWFPFSEAVAYELHIKLYVRLEKMILHITS